jgi:hypothetical protein
MKRCRIRGTRAAIEELLRANHGLDPVDFEFEEHPNGDCTVTGPDDVVDVLESEGIAVPLAFEQGPVEQVGELHLPRKPSDPKS